MGLYYDSHGAAWADFDNDGDQDLIQLADEGDGPIPTLLFVNTDDQFVEMAISLGVDYTIGRGRTPLWLDYDRDGLLDVLQPTLRHAGSLVVDGPTAIFHQTPTGFVDVAEQVGLEPNEEKSSHFAQLADLTGDGILDLLTHLGNYPSNVYDMTTEPFTDVRISLGIPNTPVVLDAAPGDFDGDLDIDIFMTRGNKDQGFVQIDDYTLETHVKGNATADLGFSFVTTGEITFDTYPIFAWNTNQIYIGAGGIHPQDIAFSLSPEDPDTWGILEHDPAVDSGLYLGYDTGTQTWQILLSNKMANLVIDSTMPISALAAIGWDPEEPPIIDRLVLNQGNGFIGVSETAGLVPSSGHSVVAGDFDNDMDLDVYVASTGPVENLPNTLYENLGDGTFTVVPDAGGAAGNNLGRADAVTTADYDNNGFLDLLVTNGQSKAPYDEDGPTFLFRNLGNGNHWLEIDLVGVYSNRDGIGVQVFVTAGGSVQLREQTGMMHHRGQNHQRLHFGLGVHTSVEALVVHWPSGIVQEYLDIEADQVIVVVEEVPVSLEHPITPPQEELEPIDLLNMPQYRIISVSPNPFNPSTEISFETQVRDRMDLEIYNVAGKHVQTKRLGILQPGQHAVHWDGRDAKGEEVGSGVYFLRIRGIRGESSAARTILVR